MKNGLILSGLILLLAAACSDSGSDTAPTPLPVVTTDDVVVVGPISGFGSVIANGVEFDTAAAIVTIDDEPGAISTLRIGMVVSIRGTIDITTGAARASEITFVDDAEGSNDGCGNDRDCDRYPAHAPVAGEVDDPGQQGG